MVLAAFLAMKGGAGKTTTTMFTAAGLAARGERTVVLDTSPQQSALKWAAVAGDQLTFDVAGPDQRIGDLARRYHHVLVDTPPEILPIIEPIIRSVEIVIGLTRPTWLDLEQAPELVDLVERLRTPDGLPIMAWLFTQSTANTLLLGWAHRIMVSAGQRVFTTEIRSWQRYAAAGGQPIRQLHGYGDVTRELLELDRTLDDDGTPP